MMLEPWENPNCPSGQLQEIFEIAEKFRAAEHAPSVRVDHFLLACVLQIYPPYAEKVLNVFEQIKDSWDDDV